VGCQSGQPRNVIQDVHLRSECRPFLPRPVGIRPDCWIQWQRAETLGALVNGVFLVALCLSIFLEAIQRLVEPQEVRNPKLVCGVGCAGLLSNILGLVLFHDHSHGHGHGHGHSHEDAEGVDAAEQGQVHDHGHSHAGRDVAVRLPFGTFLCKQCAQSDSFIGRNN
jgi:hypothetical protein